MEETFLTPSMAAMEVQDTEEEISSTDPTMPEDDGGNLDLCPSFNSYTIDGVAETAARVTTEFEGFGREAEAEAEEEDEFEFVSFQKTDEEMDLNCPIIGPVFPIFNHGTEVNESSHGNAPIVRISLEKLIIDDRERERDLDRDPPSLSLSSSSSEADELDGIPPGTYCVWTPKPVEATDQRGKCKKSKSTGSGSGSSSSSRRWKLRNLLPRSNSEGGKNLFVLLMPSSKSESSRKKSGEDAKGKKTSSEENAAAGKSKVSSASSAHELFYVRNRMLKEEDKRRSYLPYRRDLVGFWANLSSVSKALPPF